MLKQPVAQYVGAPCAATYTIDVTALNSSYIDYLNDMACETSDDASDYKRNATWVAECLVKLATPQGIQQLAHESNLTGFLGFTVDVGETLSVTRRGEQVILLTGAEIAD